MSCRENTILFRANFYNLNTQFNCLQFQVVSNAQKTCYAKIRTFLVRFIETRYHLCNKYK